MTIPNHDVVKPAKIVELASNIIDTELVLAKMVETVPVSQFINADDDTVIFKRDGQLPYRTYELRNDRANPIVKDKFFQVKVPVDLGTRIYSALDATHEQKHLDEASWGRAHYAQIQAVARGVEDTVRAAVEGVDYKVTVGGAEADLLGAVVEARRVLRRMRNRGANMFLLCGTDFFAAMNADKNITFASATGDVRATDAFAEAQLGRLKGFTVLEHVDLAPNTAYAISRDGFLCALGAPAPAESFTVSEVIQSPVPCRYTVGGDIDHLSDTQVVDTYAGCSPVLDPLHKAGLADGGPVVPDVKSLPTAFLRGVKLTLDGASKYPDKVQDKAFVDVVGVSKDHAWKPKTAPAPAPGVGG